jgi:hypothetical protein
MLSQAPVIARFMCRDVLVLRPPHGGDPLHGSGSDDSRAAEAVELARIHARRRLAVTRGPDTTETLTMSAVVANETTASDGAAAGNEDHRLNAVTACGGASPSSRRVNAADLIRGQTQRTH